jgi:hypothetical protein
MRRIVSMIQMQKTHVETACRNLTLVTFVTKPEPEQKYQEQM